MRPSPVPRRWDNRPVRSHPRRSLCVDPDSPSRLLRCAQRDRCRECGNAVEWYQRVRDRPVLLHPQELPAAALPADHRWHVSSGLAYHSGDGSAWCRLTHASICPARDIDGASVPELTRLRRMLAVHTRRLVDAGSFTPAVPADPAARQQEGPCRPARPVVQILYCVHPRHALRDRPGRDRSRAEARRLRRPNRRGSSWTGPESSHLAPDHPARGPPRPSHP
ncbi:DUF6083 domain-containing protein [Streptomyces canus]|uniref:DUF6083 domain-containing protein n=1 Tax=Streptomyces canus TaxID=58343 RepID=UPI002E3316E2|nr:DUF6083 domain-containing protein [Streptomyces canus]